MFVSLNGTWIRTLRHGAAGVLHSGVDCVVHFFSLRDRYPEEHCGFGYDLHSVNFCEDKYLGYAKLPPFLWGSHLIIGHLAYMYLV